MFSEKIAIDLGSTNVLVYSNVTRETIIEKTIVGINDKDILVGSEIDNMYIEKYYPIKKGVIADLDIAIQLLEKLIKKLKLKQLIYRPQIYLCIPTEITPVEKNIFKEIAENIGCNKINSYDVLLLSCLGNGIDVNNKATMIMNIGGETVNIGILSLGKIITKRKINFGGRNLNDELIKYLKENYKINISNDTAEQIKTEEINIYDPKTKIIKIQGIDTITSLPIAKHINVIELKNIYNNFIAKLIENIKEMIEITPVEITTNLQERGIVITGGGSLLKGLRETLEEKLEIPIYKTINPLLDTIEGLKYIINNV